MPINQDYINGLFIKYLENLPQTRSRFGINNPEEIETFRQILQENTRSRNYTEILCEIIHIHLYWRIFFRSSLVSSASASLQTGLNRASEAATSSAHTAMSYLQYAASVVPLMRTTSLNDRQNSSIDPNSPRVAPSQSGAHEPLSPRFKRGLEEVGSPKTPRHAFDEFERVDLDTPVIRSRIELFNCIITHVCEMDPQTFSQGVLSLPFQTIVHFVINSQPTHRENLYISLALPQVLIDIIERKYQNQRAPLSVPAISSRVRPGYRPNPLIPDS